MASFNTYNFYKNIYSIWVLFISLDIFFIFECDCTSPAEIDKHLQMGVQLLAKGQLQDALSHLHAAIDGDPNNYLSYFRRATVFLALGRSKMGLQDLDSAIELKPDFNHARVQRASVLTKVGRLDEAYIELEKVLQKDRSHAEAMQLISTCDMTKQKLLYAQGSLDSMHYDDALAYLKDIIETCPWSAPIREMRFEAFLNIEARMDAIMELRAITKLTQDNTEAFLRLSTLYYQNGDTEQGLIEIRECLKLDPDHKECFAFYKKAKKVAKLVTNAQGYLNNKEYTDCASSAHKILKEESTEPEIRFLGYDMLCQCEGHAGNPTEAMKACGLAIEINEDPRIYCDRAEARILNEDFEGATSDFQSALKIDENYQRANEGLQKAEKLKKQASKRDYYKILGVKRNSNKKEIKQAYRALAQKWHPDHYDGEEKAMAEKKFIDIAAAKEVLTDAEKRAKFDQGEDPLDPEQNQGHGGFNPFQNFAFRSPPRGGGGDGFPGGDNFQFKFQFN